MKKVIYLSLVMIGLLFAACSSNTPGGMAKKYMEYVKDGEYEKFADGIAIKEGATKEEIESGKTMIAALLKEKAAKIFEKKGGIKEIEVVSETISDDGQSADVVLKSIYGDGSSEESNCKMLMQDGKWKMNMQK